MSTKKESSVYDEYTKDKINFSDYENDPKDYQRWGGILIEAAEVPWEAISIDKRNHQTRARDTDPGHVARLAADIAVKKLKRLPYVERCPDGEKLIPLSGHHRLFAIRKNFVESKEHQGPMKFPVAIVEFPSKGQRARFKQKENDHRPSKGHSKDDAIRFLRELKDDGEFDGLEAEEIRTKVYGLLTEFHPRIQGPTKKSVYEQIYTPPPGNVKRFQSTELEAWREKIFGGNYSSGHVEGDVCFISGETHAQAKTLGNRASKRAVALEKGNSCNPLAAKIMAHFKTENVQSLEDARKKHLETMAASNRRIWCINKNPGAAYITEVIYLPQVLAPASKIEKHPQKYEWDASAEEFKRIRFAPNAGKKAREKREAEKEAAMWIEISENVLRKMEKQEEQEE